MSMTLSELASQRRVAAEPASRQELDELRALAARNLQDAALPVLSADGKFSMAYDAARTTANTAIRAAGYRVKPTGGAHYNTFLALEAALGLTVANLAAYLDGCRVKRNELSYDAASLVGESDAEELLENAKELRNLVEGWISQNHPRFVLLLGLDGP